jgi:hypothetical protein
MTDGGSDIVRFPCFDFGLLNRSPERVKPAETPVMDDYPELPECLRRKCEQTGMKVKTY